VEANVLAYCKKCVLTPVAAGSGLIKVQVKGQVWFEPGDMRRYRFYDRDQKAEQQLCFVESPLSNKMAGNAIEVRIEPTY
jgi:hypothetical protein